MKIWARFFEYKFWSGVEKTNAPVPEKQKIKFFWPYMPTSILYTTCNAILQWLYLAAPGVQPQAAAGEDMCTLTVPPTAGNIP